MDAILYITGGIRFVSRAMGQKAKSLLVTSFVD
jgi:hypothetical protein